MADYFPTKHAVQAMAARGVTWAEILQVLDQPEVVYSGSSGAHAGKGTEIRQRDKLYVVVSTTPVFDYYDKAKQTPLLAVVTVGLRTERRWNNDDMLRRDAVATP